MTDLYGARSFSSFVQSLMHMQQIAGHCAVVVALAVAMGAGCATVQAQGIKRSSTAPKIAPSGSPDGMLGGGMSPTLNATAADTRTADYIVAVVNQEPITNSDVVQRMLRVMQETPSDKQPPRDELRAHVLDALIEERSQIAFARESGVRIDDTELDRAVESIAAQNELTVTKLRERLQQDGQDYDRFRRNLRERMLLERLREREVPPRIKISEADIDAYIAEQLGHAATERELSIAQILIAVPEGATPAEAAARKARADAVLSKARSGEDFIKLAHEFSDDPTTRDGGGEMGWKVASRLPDLFVEASNTLKPGDIASNLVRSGAGYHVVKLIDRRDAIQGYAVVQHHARHILMRPSAAQAPNVTYDKLVELRQQILGGQASFAQLARQYSQDGSATRGGDLGWSQPGQFVPEFQQVLDRMQPGQISMPITTRFGIHLIQLLDRRDAPVDPKQLRDNARTALREQRFEPAYQQWAQEIRAQAYVEIREPRTP